ncbi:MAG TPA: hypothetical protein VK112_09725 [Fodinibius sp.]|nr:hypothetical protein [Fodinibius sp.]
MKNILRMESAGVKGWRVQMVINGEQTSKLFSDRVIGSKQEALDAALAYRERLWEKRGEPEFAHESYEKRFYYPDGMGENSTGVVGVYRTLEKMKSGRRYPYYTTTIHVQKGQALTRARSVRRHGERAAFLHVCEIRKGHMQEIYPDRFDEARFDRSVEQHLQRIEKGYFENE